ncbi:MAG: hypothetical protein BGO37_16105 [Cellulomonas sp. 73-92]|uniref:SLAC1 family transporter n=1 Tax=Cellulomonas sp. 73-92 TaxID=1895740 RepID=UPI0009288D1C|nr:hypothetical protein [Cellulomonas sp. 73-92]OJV81023.1 MAG: hypothetical protein BGO37_16105 [Cellulomonas sp. 73-92]
MTTNVSSSPAAAAAPPAPAAASAASRMRDLHPGWFAAVMGTGIVAVASDDNPGGLAALQPAAHTVGVALAVLAYALGAVLLVAYAVRWVRHAAACRADLRHPVLGALHATLPAGLLVLSVMTSAVGPRFLPASVTVPLAGTLLALGAAIGLVLGVAFAYTLFTGEVAAASVNGGWFIPPVVTIIIPVALAALVPHVGPGDARLLLALGYATFGMGFVLFLLTMGLLFARLVLHPLPPAALAPTVWIALGPVGVGALAALALARAMPAAVPGAAGAVATPSLLFASALWGFGVWWLAVAVALLVRYLRAGGFAFHLGWWAFTFPLGALTVATLGIARAWQAPALDAVGAVLYVGLVVVWAVVGTRTVRGVLSGRIWQR